MEVRRILLLVNVIVIFLASVAQASVTLGSIQPEKSTSVRPGETADFKILLFSSSQTHVKLISKAPEGWDISITPEEFDLPTEENPEYVVLSGEYVRATPVHIKITPLNTEPGEYEIKVIAQAGLDKGGTIAALQERDFSFKIKILEEALVERAIKEMSQSPVDRNLTEGSVTGEYQETTEKESPKDSDRESNMTGDQSGTSGITGMVTEYSTPVLIWIVFLIIAIPLLLWGKRIKKSSVMA